MKVLFIDNQGGGFADFVNVEGGTTAEQFFGQRYEGQHPDDYLIRVNRQPVSKDQVLQEGDRITVTPTKIEGAVTG